nr:hypothetical protein [Tanacetum cinerariifolium]
MCGRMFPEESDEVEKYDATEFATELMDQKIRTLTERQVENKRKFEDTSRNNQNQHQPFKRHNVARAYTAGLGDKKPYGGSKPLSFVSTAFSSLIDIVPTTLDHGYDIELADGKIIKTDCKTIFTKLITIFENDFNSEFKERMQRYTRFDAQSFKDAMICNMDSIGKYMLEITLHQQWTPHLLKQKKLMQTQEDHSNPIPVLNVDSLRFDLFVIQNSCSEKEDSNSKTASSKSVKERILDSATKDVHAIKYKMSQAKQNKYFVEYTGLEVKHFRYTLLQHMGNVKKSVAERTRHQRYGTESKVQDDNGRSGNDTDTDDADIRPIYDEKPLAEVQLTAKCNIFAIGQHHTEQPKIINEGRVDQYPEQC